jgi:hypothetical protein
MGNDISMNDPGNDVFSTIPPLKLARMGVQPHFIQILSIAAHFPQSAVFGVG